MYPPPTIAPNLILYGDLSLAEPDVAVGAEDAARPEVGGELGEELLHGPLSALLIDGLVLLPVRLRVVGLQSLEELERL